MLDPGAALAEPLPGLAHLGVRCWAAEAHAQSFLLQEDPEQIMTQLQSLVPQGDVGSCPQ